VSNVLAEAGLPSIQRWVPFPLDREELLDRIGNKMIRPTTIPQTLEELVIEQAIAREALRLSFVQHKALAVGLRGVARARTISDAFTQSAGGESLVDMMKLDLIIGSGGVLSHAPRRAQSLLMMLDAFLPEGVTELAVDSIFMMPHLGLLSTIAPTAANQVFEKDCLVRLGTTVAPVGTAKPGQPVLSVRLEGRAEETLRAGELRRLPLPEGESVRAVLAPARGFDVGAGRGERRELALRGGAIGLVFDGRGRPLVAPDAASLERWARELDAYPR